MGIFKNYAEIDALEDAQIIDMIDKECKDVGMLSLTFLLGLLDGKRSRRYSDAMAEQTAIMTTCAKESLNQTNVMAAYTKEMAEQTVATVEQTKVMVRATNEMRALTWFIAIMTTVSVICTVVQLLRPTVVVMAPNQTAGAPSQRRVAQP